MGEDIKRNMRAVLVTPEGVVPYVPGEIEKVKFICYLDVGGEDLLIVGDWLCLETNSHPLLLSLYKSFGNQVPDRKPDGPGDYKDGEWFWGSRKFGVTTEDESLKERIREALGIVA